MRSTTVLAFLAALVVAAPAVAQNRIAAVVNDDMISVHELEARTSLAIASSGMQDGVEARRRILPQVLRRLIDEKLQLQEAARLNLPVTEADIDAGIANIEQNNRLPPGSFDGLVRRLGIDPPLARQQIKAEIGWGRVVRRTIMPMIKIGDEEVDSQLEMLRANLGRPEYLANEIMLAVDAPEREDEVRRLGERLLEQLHSGIPFTALARQFSQSATAAAGGDLGWVTRGMIEDDVLAVIETLRPGTVSSLVRGIGGYFIVALRDRRTAGAVSAGDATLSLVQVFLPLRTDASAAEKSAQASKAAEIARSLTTCAEAEQAAKDSGAPQSGSINNVRARDLPEPILRAVSGLKPGQVAPPQSVADGTSILMVCGRTEPDANLPQRSDITRRLENERLESAARRSLRDLRRAAFIEVRI